MTSTFVAIINIGINFLLLLGQNTSFLEKDYLGSVAIAVLGNCIIVIIIEILFYNQMQLDAEKRALAAEKSKIQFKYDTLRSQIKPHFLFNSLNTLTSLIYENQDKANIFTKKLSALYRYTLSLNDCESVTLVEELSFSESYLNLMQIRFDTALVIKIEKTISQNNDKLIPMSIQLLVENAIKHNVIIKAHPFFINILIDNNGISISNNL